ncbi:hypothetical protein [Kineosporia sp. NBRC 101677]|uniref:hypothetical protein n=1 Tax=Kineosporia sp. NBRC 101677 TaxID=3032197 RepID=UPI002555E78E|nr:hypothetical protein [Kineosporia sp. NBRC 101677]
MTTTTTTAVADTLQRLYFVRFAFAIAWALALFTTAKDLGVLAGTLLVIYPLFDVGAAVVDARSSHRTGSVVGLYVNMAVSSITAIAVAVAATSGIPDVLRVWGTWAIVAGAVQLAVSLSRRAMGGQWPLILSGAISVLAGASFIAGAGADDPTLAGAAGYAIPGGVFFLVSALRLRSASKGK